MIEKRSDVETGAILRITEEEVGAIETGDAERYLSLLSEDAVFMPQNETSKTGDELRAWLRAFLDQVAIHYTRFTHGETIVRDDVAFHAYSCAWTATPKRAGNPRSLSFKGMHVLRREPNGSWKIAVSIWNTDPEPIRQ